MLDSGTKGSQAEAQPAPKPAAVQAQASVWLIERLAFYAVYLAPMLVAWRNVPGDDMMAVLFLRVLSVVFSIAAGIYLFGRPGVLGFICALLAVMGALNFRFIFIGLVFPRGWDEDNFYTIMIWGHLMWLIFALWFVWVLVRDWKSGRLRTKLP